MWFLIGSIGILVLIIVAALVSDLRQRAKRRRLGEARGSGDVEAAARSVRAGMDVKGGGRTTGAMKYGQHDIGT